MGIKRTQNVITQDGVTICPKTSVLLITEHMTFQKFYNTIIEMMDSIWLIDVEIPLSLSTSYNQIVLAKKYKPQPGSPLHWRVIGQNLISEATWKLERLHVLHSNWEWA
jgi:hypothetical protein